MPSKPRRTMLPPNLTRNYYEVKRLIAEGEDRAPPHWYQLTAKQQAEPPTAAESREAAAPAAAPASAPAAPPSGPWPS
ncbi:hypothetical protein [Streptomyces collinus]|uniref:hypothetical protein n=1 Tax=Streptomyces collinus TaxID=42684 RepID=UPI0037AB774E